MWRQLKMIGMTLLALLAIDAAVAVALRLGETRLPALRPLVTYFEYGRSVPGKLERWIAHPDEPGNLFEVAWLGSEIAISAERFAKEAPDRPVIRAYGMSFVSNILRPAAAMRPELIVDELGGPGAPPNFVYAAFLEDRPFRRRGDVVVLGILSSSVPAMASMSNRTWLFEQPAPFTYPIFRPDPDGAAGLISIEPIVSSVEDELSRAGDPVLDEAWKEQLRTEDAFFTEVAFSVPWLDWSPFVRLVRRALAVNAIDRRERELMSPNGFAYRETLENLIAEFAAIAREDGQIPIVMLIQGRDPDDMDLLSELGPSLRADGIGFLATTEHFNPRDASGFVADGHYRSDVDAIFAEAFLSVLDRVEAPARDGRSTGGSK